MFKIEKQLFTQSRHFYNLKMRVFGTIAWLQQMLVGNHFLKFSIVAASAIFSL
jgi:hypothetical protein